MICAATRAYSHLHDGSRMSAASLQCQGSHLTAEGVDARLAAVKGAGSLMQAPGQAIVGQGLLQHVLHGSVDIHGLIGRRRGDRLCLSLSIGHNLFLSTCTEGWLVSHLQQ